MTSLPSKHRNFKWIEFAMIVLSASIPLFVTMPYRLNIFLSWDGAYRISNGEIPYKDFGLPLGYGFWIIPALFFKLFGPQMITLVKAQVFINILSGLSFLSILYSLRVNFFTRFISLFVYIISFSFFNFWPWYNHTVIVYEFISIAFLLKFILPVDGKKPKIYQILLAAFFMFFSFFTKQDAGGLGLIIALVLLSYYSILHKTLKPIIYFLLFYVDIALVIILPLLPYHFGYWFNHGQPPHSSRLAINDFLNDFFGASQWLKFYLILSVVLLLPFIKEYKQFLKNERLMIATLLVIGIYVEAFIFQITSYTPPNNNIFYHSFAFVFILILLQEHKVFHLYSITQSIFICLLVLLWWSDIYWKYIEQKVENYFPEKLNISGEHIISRKNYQINLDTNRINIPQSNWVISSIPDFKKLTMPAPTIAGINRLINNQNVLSKISNNRILNMTELTPLSHVMGFTAERGCDFPLWYHLGVGMFNKQKISYINKIQNGYYDVVLFENIPALNNFYPFEIRDSLRQHYHIVDSFLAPRSPTNGMIEVYIKQLQLDSLHKK